MTFQTYAQWVTLASPFLDACLASHSHIPLPTAPLEFSRLFNMCARKEVDPPSVGKNEKKNLFSLETKTKQLLKIYFYFMCMSVFPACV